MLIAIRQKTPGIICTSAILLMKQIWSVNYGSGLFTILIKNLIQSGVLAVQVVIPSELYLWNTSLPLHRLIVILGGTKSVVICWE